MFSIVSFALALRLHSGLAELRIRNSRKKNVQAAGAIRVRPIEQVGSL